jgi:hypothetical protein
MALQDYAEIISGATQGRLQMQENGEVLILSAKNLANNDELTLSKNEKYTQRNADIEHQLIRSGDIILVTTGNIKLIGNMFLYNLPIMAIASSNLTIIRPFGDSQELYSLLERRYYHIKTMAPTTNRIIPRISRRQICEIELEN